MPKIAALRPIPRSCVERRFRVAPLVVFGLGLLFGGRTTSGLGDRSDLAGGLLSDPDESDDELDDELLLLQLRDRLAGGCVSSSSATSDGCESGASALRRCWNACNLPLDCVLAGTEQRGGDDDEASTAVGNWSSVTGAGSASSCSGAEDWSIICRLSSCGVAMLPSSSLSRVLTGTTTGVSAADADAAAAAADCFLVAVFRLRVALLVDLAFPPVACSWLAADMAL